MDYEGENMWMIALNVVNEGGEMRSVSMDGEREQRNVAGLETAHHDFTVMPGGKIAALMWREPGYDTESDLVIRSPDGTVATPFTIGGNLYVSDTFHANAIHYIPSDGSFTIADRNPNVLVKVSATGTPEWQLGGQCDSAPAGDRCAARDWQVNHGHHLLEDGTFVLFNNGYGHLAHILEFKLDATPTSFAATLVEGVRGRSLSHTHGRRAAPAGRQHLVTYSTRGKHRRARSELERGPDLFRARRLLELAADALGPPARP